MRDSSKEIRGGMQMTNLRTDLDADAKKVMEQIQMAESRHMQLGTLISYQLEYPDMTIRDFFHTIAAEIEDQEEEN